MATYVNNLRLTELATGEGSGTWGTTTNTNLELIGEALGYGSEAIANASTHTITVADGTADSARSFYLKLTGGGQACTVTLAPNTLSKVWMVENTTNSTLTFTQGSGANVAIAAGAVKMIATDGAGSGAVVYDLLVDTDLTGTTTVVNLTSSGTIDAATVEFNSLSGTGSVAITDILDQDNMSSNSATALATQQSIKAYVDSSVASFDTLAEVLAQGNTTGSTDIEVTTAQKVQFRDSAIYINSSADGQLDIVADTEIQIAATTIDANGNLDVSGTIAAGGVVTANAGVVVDNFTLNGTTLALSSGDFTVDVAGDIILDADGGSLIFRDGGTTIAQFDNSSSDLQIINMVSDKDIIFRGNDGGSFVNALTLDMSAAGAATFNAGITTGGNVVVGGTLSANSLTIDDITINSSTISDAGNLTIDSGGDIILDADGANIIFKNGGTEFGQIITNATPNDLVIRSSISDEDMIFQGNDGGSIISALTLDMSAAGAATFNSSVTATSLDISGDIDVDGVTNLDVVDIDGAVDMASTLNVSGNLTVGSNIIASTFTVDAGGDINLDANGGDIILLDNGTGFGRFTNSSTDFVIKSDFQDKDMKFQGNDGGVGINALILDMSAAGAATFNAGATFGSTVLASNASSINIVLRGGDGNSKNITFQKATGAAEQAKINAIGDDLTIYTGPTSVERASFNSSEAVFNDSSTDTDFRVESNDLSHMLFVDSGNNRIGIGQSVPDERLHLIDNSNSALMPFVIGNEDHTDNSTSQSIAMGFGLARDSGTVKNNAGLIQVGKTAAWTADDGQVDSYMGLSIYKNNAVTEHLKIEPTQIRLGNTADHVMIDIAASNAAIKLVDNSQSNPPTIRGNGPNFLIENGGVERVAIDGSGNTVVNETGADADFRIESNDNSYMFYVDGGLNLVGFNASSAASTSGASFLVYAGGMKLDIGHNGSAANGDQYVAFRRNGTALGSITQNSATGVFYNTTSDQRLKENIADADDAGSKVDSIQVRKFDWKEDGSHQDYGMVAQELQTVAPEAVSAPENPEEMMGVDYSKLVPMLIKEIQSLRARIAALES